MNRSVTTEQELEAGQYSVMIKITASRDKSKKLPEEIVRETSESRPAKLMAVGLSYDLAHAKGRLKESELERKDRLRKERRDKRKLIAKKAFEAQRLMDKKEKLRRLRLEAKEKAKLGGGLESSQDIDHGFEVSIKVGENTLRPAKLQSIEAAEGSRVVSQEGTSKQLKIILEASDKVDGAKSGDKTMSGKIEQPTEGGENQAEDAKQASEGAKDESNDKGQMAEDSNFEAVSAIKNGQERDKESSISTISEAIATPAETSDAAQDSKQDGDQPNDKTDKSAAAEEAGDNANKATNVVEAGVLLQDLTLDTISDDGLSWSSDIDAPCDSSTSSDSDSDTEEPVPPAIDSSQTPGASADDDLNDPWNAVCVFGLRVYSKGSEAEIEVVRKEDDAESVGTKKLDVDDQAADATKKLHKGSPREEEQLSTMGTAPAWDEGSKQG